MHCGRSKVPPKLTDTVRKSINCVILISVSARDSTQTGRYSHHDNWAILNVIPDPCQDSFFGKVVFHQVSKSYSGATTPGSFVRVTAQGAGTRRRTRHSVSPVIDSKRRKIVPARRSQMKVTSSKPQLQRATLPSVVFRSIATFCRFSSLPGLTSVCVERFLVSCLQRHQWVVFPSHVPSKIIIYLCSKSGEKQTSDRNIQELSPPDWYSRICFFVYSKGTRFVPSGIPPCKQNSWLFDRLNFPRAPTFALAHAKGKQAG